MGETSTMMVANTKDHALNRLALVTATVLAKSMIGKCQFKYRHEICSNMINSLDVKVASAAKEFVSRFASNSAAAKEVVSQLVSNGEYEYDKS